MGAVCPSIELAASRLVASALPAAVLADGAWNGCFVIGARVAPGDVPGGAPGLVAAGAALSVNGAEVAANTGANVLGSPLTALVGTLSYERSHSVLLERCTDAAAVQTWVANELAGTAHALRAGQLVMTGAAAAHKVVAAGDALTATFTGLGAAPLSVSVKLTQ